MSVVEKFNMLDEFFGRALPPSLCPNNSEERYTPKSLEKLDANSGRKLRSLLHEIENGVNLSKFTFHSLSILWVLDELGDIYFAVEEVVDSRGENRFPKPYNLNDLPRGREKLGHPSLIKCEKARIAGEIKYDMGADSPTWNIDNNSGRYGLRKETEKTHLDNVSKEFAKHGILLEAWFIEGHQ